MSQRNYVFHGKAYWARVYEGQEDSYDDGPEKYKISVALDDEGWSKFKESGIRLKPRKLTSDDDAPLGVTFTRDKEPKVLPDGKKLGGGVPRVKDKNGDLMTPDQLIGNESEVEVLVNVYKPKAKPGKKSMTGHRLEAVKVLNWIPYEMNDEDDEEEEEGTEEAPKKSKKLDDDIPF